MNMGLRVRIDFLQNLPSVYIFLNNSSILAIFALKINSSMLDLFVGTGIAHSILLFAFVIAIGLWLGKFKVKGISIG